MKTGKSQKVKRSKTLQKKPLPSYSRKATKFLSPLEMAVYHHFSFTYSDRKSCKALNLPPDDFNRLLKSAIDKMHLFFDGFSAVKEEVRRSIYPPKGKNRLIETLGFSTRIKHSLLSAEINTVGQLCLLKEYDLKRIRGIGAGSIKEIKAVVKKHKLKSPLL